MTLGLRLKFVLLGVFSSLLVSPGLKKLLTLGFVMRPGFVVSKGFFKPFLIPDILDLPVRLGIFRFTLDDVLGLIWNVGELLLMRVPFAEDLEVLDGAD